MSGEHDKNYERVFMGVLGFDELLERGGSLSKSDVRFLGECASRLAEVIERYKSGDPPVPDDPDWVEKRFTKLGYTISPKVDDGGIVVKCIPQIPDEHMANLPA